MRRAGQDLIYVRAAFLPEASDKIARARGGARGSHVVHPRCSYARLGDRHAAEAEDEATTRRGGQRRAKRDEQPRCHRRAQQRRAQRCGRQPSAQRRVRGAQSKMREEQGETALFRGGCRRGPRGGRGGARSHDRRGGRRGSQRPGEALEGTPGAGQVRGIQPSIKGERGPVCPQGDLPRPQSGEQYAGQLASAEEWQ